LLEKSSIKSKNDVKFRLTFETSAGTGTGSGGGGVHENATRHFFASLSSDFRVLGGKLKAKASLKTHYFIFENQLIQY